MAMVIINSTYIKSKLQKPVKSKISYHNSDTIQMTLSHHKTRIFKPDMLNKPREFEIPDFIKEYNYSRPLVVEIGAGKGKHAFSYAQTHPTHNLIAIERTKNKFNAFRTLLDSNDYECRLDNLHAVHADAIPYCVYALPANSVDVFYILYPNPEPKNPNQQWLNMPFFEFLLSRLKANGKVILASNIKDYIQNAYHESRFTWCLETHKYEVPKDSKRTHFEIKYLARGEICWELSMIKPQGYTTRFDDWNSSVL